MIENGTMLNRRYEILAHIGSGGMADVYKGMDHNLNRFVALKVLRREFNEDEAFVKKFLAEARSTAGLSHPNIVNIYDSGDDNGIHYIVMELAEGMTLKQYIRRYGRLSVREIVDFSTQIAGAIQAAHSKHIIHRDIKPQNILVSDSGKIKVTDFGIAKLATSDTISSNAMGSVRYISPEQARGGYSDERADIYSLGITMYEMATGKVPFDGENSVAIAIMHLRNEIEPPRSYFPDIPQSLENIILKCTMKQPDQRYQTASELITDLGKVFSSPDGSYVYVNPMMDDSPTDIWEKEDVKKGYQEQQKKDYEEQNQKNRQRINEVREEEEDSGDDDEDMSPKMQKVIRAITVIFAVLTIAIVIYLIVNASRLFHIGGDSTTSAKSDTTETTTEIQYVSMPKLTGKSKSEAKSALKELGLGVSFLYEDGVSAETKNLVVKAQEYSEGESVPAGTTVQVTLGKDETNESTTESERVTVPALVNMQEDEAEQTLEALGLKIQKAYATSDTVKKGYIIKQNPKGDTVVNRGFTITVTVSQGVSQVSVPSLYGMSEASAKKELERVGLELGEVKSGYSGDVGVGDVFKQDIASGTKVDKGTAVGITTSIGEEETFSYQGSITIEDSPFEGSESGSVKLVLEQGSYKNTFYNKSKVTSSDFPLSETFEGKEAGDATVKMYVNGDLYKTYNVTVDAMDN